MSRASHMAFADILIYNSVCGSSWASFSVMSMVPRPQPQSPIWWLSVPHTPSKLHSQCPGHGTRTQHTLLCFHAFTHAVPMAWCLLFPCWAPCHPSEIILGNTSHVKFSLWPPGSVQVPLSVCRAPNTLDSIIWELCEGRKWFPLICISPVKSKPVQAKSNSVLLETEKITDFNKNVCLDIKPC